MTNLPDILCTSLSVISASNMAQMTCFIKASDNAHPIGSVDVVKHIVAHNGEAVSAASLKYF